MAALSKQQVGFQAGVFTLYLATNLGGLLLASESQNRKSATKYVSSTAVTISELIKLVTSLLAIRAGSGSMGGTCAAVSQALLRSPMELLKVCLPAALYTVQNNVIYTALSHLDPVTFQITYQLKIVSSLLCSRLLLGRPVPRVRWVSMLLLTLGVVLVQLSQQKDGYSSKDSEAGRNRAMGLISVLLACGCSGLAGSFMELLLKSSKTGLAQRNLQVLRGTHRMLATYLAGASDCTRNMCAGGHGEFGACWSAHVDE